jgi:hypothetical protein
MASGGLFSVGDYIFAYAYPLGFIGAILYSVLSLLNIDPSSIIANKNISVILSVLITTSGLISFFTWMHQDVPILGNTLLPNGRGVIKIRQ